MASDSHEPTRRSKNHRSSIDDSVEPSKRRKHRHRRHKHDDDVAERVEEGEREGEETSRHVARSRPDSDLEEGEIIEDADDSIMGIHSAQSEAGDRSSLPENGKDIENNLVKKSSYDASKEYESPVKNKPEMSDNDDSNDSNSHIKRSQSLSISEKGFPLKTTHKKDDPISKDAKKASNDLDDEKLAVRNWDSRHGYRDGMREKERERSSSRSRYRELDRDRERSRESWDKERYGRREKIEDHGGERHKEKRSSRDRVRETEMERDRERDKEREREKSRDRERQRIREREERELERERERRKERELERGRENGRNRSRDRERYGGRESERKRSRDRESYGDRESGRNRNRDRDDDRKKDLRNSRDDETDYKNRAKKDKENGATRDEEEQEDYQERVALQLVDQEEDDVDRIKEESRRRRQAILEKYKMQQQQQLHKPQLENEDKEHIGQVSEVDATSVSPETSTMRNKEDAGTTISGDPSLTVSKSPTENVTASEKTSGVGGLGEGTPKSERSGGDMFCDDIFGDSPTGVRKTGKGDGLAIERGGLHDNWDDAEGYYSFRFGEILDGRYEVAAAHGKGVFSTVVRAKDLRAGPGDPEEVAIKIIRNNEHMHKAGKEELVILKKLVGADPEDRRHCVRFLSSFNYRNHLCLVFESLNMNLREVLKKFGRNIGLKLTAVRLYAKQLFIALKHLKNCGVLHSDIKPDNMLVNEAKNVLKLCDFGNAMFAGKNEITPYLVSRFYRAPEIILGLTYDYPLDIWSVGCCLFELYSGKVLFPGATNNDMLRLHMELKGLFPKKMLRKGAFTEQHFDQDLNFLAVEEDPVTKRAMRRLITSIKPKDIGAIVTGSPGEDPKMLANFKDLLEKIFILDPDKRLTVSQALSHPFITGK